MDQQRRVDRISAGVVGVVAVLYLLVRGYRLLTIGGGFDSTLLGNVLWRLAHGFDSQTAITGGHYLSTHASPILALFLPIFRAVPALGMPVIYAAQSASVALVGWAGYLVASHYELPSSTRWWLTGAMLVSPGALLATQHQVHETTLGIGPLAMALALVVRGDRLSRVMPWALIAASCRIEMAAAVSVAGIVVWSFNRRREGLAMVAVGVAFLGGYLSWLFLNPYETESIAAHFAHLGPTPGAVLQTAFTRPLTVLEPLWDPLLLISALFWLFPFGLLPPLARPRWLIVALPTAGIAIFGVWRPADSPLEHYWYALLVAGAIAAPLAVATNQWLFTRIRVLLVAGVMAGWLLLSPFYGFLFPANTLTANDRQLAGFVHGLDPGFISVSPALSHVFIDVPLLAVFPRPFVCAETGVGPYTAPDSPPEIVIMPVGGMERLDEVASSRLASLLRVYDRTAVSDHFEVWEMVDAARAQDSYVPCSSSTFSPST